MKVVVKTLTDEEIKRRDYMQGLSIEIDGNLVFSVYDGEPEDNNLSRNFNDCFKIKDLLIMAYNADSLEIVEEKVNEF